MLNIGHLVSPPLLIIAVVTCAKDWYVCSDFFYYRLKHATRLVAFPFAVLGFSRRRAYSSLSPRLTSSSSLTLS